jgi:hypothetical protein
MFYIVSYNDFCYPQGMTGSEQELGHLLSAEERAEIAEKCEAEAKWVVPVVESARACALGVASAVLVPPILLIPTPIRAAVVCAGMAVYVWTNRDELSATTEADAERCVQRHENLARAK